MPIVAYTLNIIFKGLILEHIKRFQIYLPTEIFKFNWLYIVNLKYIPTILGRPEPTLKSVRICLIGGEN